MSSVPIQYFLVVAAALFVIGSVGFLLRRNLLVLLMSIELMLNAVNLTLVAYNRAQPLNLSATGTPVDHTGQILAFFVIAVAAAEAAVGLAIVLAFFRVRRSVRSDDADILRN
ncbi:MAG: NADH-quinone oxidoreductase subunit NuoK [Polyangiaceae bacterium]